MPRKNTAPRYWFGYGLSYTNFAYSDLQVAAKKAISAQVTVVNSGALAGQTVVQLFLTSGPANVGKRLLAFQKVALQPGESKRVTLPIDPRLLARFDEAGHQWRIAKGTYNLVIGSDAGTAILDGSATLPASILKP